MVFSQDSRHNLFLVLYCLLCYSAVSVYLCNLHWIEILLTYGIFRNKLFFLYLVALKSTADVTSYYLMYMFSPVACYCIFYVYSAVNVTDF